MCIHLYDVLIRTCKTQFTALGLYTLLKNVIGVWDTQQNVIEPTKNLNLRLHIIGFNN